MNKEDIEGLIKGEKQTIEENRGSDMESYLEGRLSAFEDILDSLKGEGDKRDERESQIRGLKALIDGYKEKIETFKRVITECESDIRKLEQDENKRGKGKGKKMSDIELVKRAQEAIANKCRGVIFDELVDMYAEGYADGHNKATQELANKEGGERTRNDN